MSPSKEQVSSATKEMESINESEIAQLLSIYLKREEHPSRFISNQKMEAIKNAIIADSTVVVPPNIFVKGRIIRKKVWRPIWWLIIIGILAVVYAWLYETSENLKKIIIILGVLLILIGLLRCKTIEKHITVGELILTCHHCGELLPLYKSLALGTGEFKFTTENETENLNDIMAVHCEECLRLNHPSISNEIEKYPKETREILLEFIQDDYQKHALMNDVCGYPISHYIDILESFLRKKKK